MLLPRLSDRTRLILTALSLAIIVTVSGLLVPERYAHWEQSKWLRFVVVTALLVFYELKAYWKLRKSGRFWILFLSLLTAYVLWVGHLFSTGNGLPLVSFVLVRTAQFLYTAMTIYWVLGVGPSDVNLNV